MDEDKTKEQLVGELAELRQRIAALEASETERKLAEGGGKQYLHGLKFLSETATEFVEFPLAGDIYRFMGEKLKELVGNSVVAVTSLDEASDSLCIRALLGLGKRAEAVAKVVGGDPIGMSFEIDDQAKRELTLGKLMKVPGGVYDLSPGLPKAIGRALEKLLGLGDVYAMGFAREGQLFGSAVVLMRKGERLENHDVIETFIRQASVALQRKRAEEALRESQQMFQRVVDNMPVLFDAFDEKGIALFWNKECERVTGYSAEEIVGNPKSLELLWPDPEYRAWFLEQLEKLGHEYHDWEIEIRRKDGETRTIAWSNTSRDNPIPGWWSWGTGVDVTERKRAEEALQKRERELRVIAENVPALFSYVDAEGCYRFVNKQYEEWFGIPRTEIIGKHYRQVLGEATYELIKDRVEAVLSGRRICYEEALPFAHGGTRWVIADYVPDAGDQGKVRGFFALVTDITERKQAEEEIRQRTFQLEALRQVSLGLAAQVDLDALLRSIVARAVALLKGTGGGLYLYRPEQDVLEWTATIGPHLAPTGAILRRGESLSGKVWKSGEPILVDDYQHWEGRAAIHEDYPFRSAVGVPVLWGGEFLGVLNVLAFSPHTFSPADAELLSLFATQAAIAIENARLFEQEREQRELSKALEEAAAAVSSTLDLEQVLDRILEQVERVIAGDAFSILLIEGDVARLARWRGYEMPGEKAHPLRFEIPIAKYPNLKKMTRTGKPVVVPDTAVDLDWVPAARDQGWRRSYVGVPVQVGGVTVGFLNVSGTRPGQFGPADARRLEAFASHAATAIKNARLFQAEREQRELAEALAEAAAVVGSTLDLDQVLATVLEEVRRLLDVVACSVWLVEPGADEMVCRQAVGPQSEIVRGWRLALGEGLAGRVARNGESLIVSDAQADERHFKGVDQQTGLVLRSILSVPLRVKENVIGVLQVVDTAAERFGPTELTLLEPLAATAAIAIENARLYEQARHDAETRATLLQEVNHRVKNNLTAIIGLLYAEQRYTRVEDQPAYRTMMRDLANRIRGLARVHTMLSAAEWAPLPLDELTRQIIQVSLQMLPRDKHFSVDVTPSPVRVTPKQASSLALVINELATNTVKYALPEREPAHISVRIACEDEDDTVLFEFRDNGSGYPEEVLRLESHNVGLYLIQTMVRDDLGGEVALRNDDGAVTTIQFKKDPSGF
jgi:PAS domain S-box-containing protein